MDLSDLHQRQTAERNSDALQPLPDTFYREVAEFISDLQTRREQLAEESGDPLSSPEIRSVSREIEQSRSAVEGIYERRVAKILRSVRSDRSLPRNHMTPEEKRLLSDVTAEIEAFWTETRTWETHQDEENESRSSF